MSLQRPEGSQPVCDGTVQSKRFQSVVHQTMSERQSQRQASPAQDPQQHIKGESQLLCLTESSANGEEKKKKEA